MSAQSEALFRNGGPADAAVLSALALRSKALWPYDEAFIAACKDELTYSEAQLEDRHMIFRVAEIDKVVAAFAALDLRKAGEEELLALFVDPLFVRQGLGQQLWRDAVRVATSRGVRALQIASDPYAEPFYAAMGARRIGGIASQSIAGRVLPLMRYSCPVLPRGT